MATGVFTINVFLLKVGFPLSGKMFMGMCGCHRKPNVIREISRFEKRLDPPPKDRLKANSFTTFLSVTTVFESERSELRCE